MAAIVQERTIAAAPERVWGALTKPDEIAGWWTNDLSAKPEVGPLAEFRYPRQGAAVFQFEVAELDEGSKVRWISRQGPPHWAGTSITWQLTPVHNGTQVAFNHDGFAQVDKRYELTRAWWEHFLDSLKFYLETGKGTPGLPVFVSQKE